ncbi:MULTISPECIES: 3-hydroxyacyl-ACP dehydratase FabZ [Hydrogenibacillus]|uniref:3-hydroxyacyl-[acyl-carrier-protein] dehydratase FabZ n=1 Tax=Hydrogenibacillus schlegelii TaxID=1484 RepID=A0A2T5GEI5_HYDSH|nr:MULTISPECIES: 3-hydroxyacyl-ACP dehydratase FabZ [Hydrogenibacillus]MBT9282208.1 3-hydroxyacyl-ACP dehydratase FabZ [Hydrogenibacillus schlegelii]PTQ54589.1 MAG: 3-hydroxyacyl-[acyl-carrier-protein] dehydratase, FabZ form [Hydrogenibacillus schlegelii]QZA32934.1 3-hydroxyacyl-ACP dehydratase FabZ [Hydrogenibacillus sp. N12]
MHTIEDIQAVLPHRPPFLLVDRILAVEPGVRAEGIKAVTINEPYFIGHFPGYAVMPGVLIVEALAQVGAFALLSHEDYRGKLPLFAGLDGVRFRRPVRPGDVLYLAVEIERMKGPIGRGRGVATVEGEVAAEGTLLFAVRAAARPEADAAR